MYGISYGISLARGTEEREHPDPDRFIAELAGLIVVLRRRVEKSERREKKNESSEVVGNTANDIGFCMVLA